MTCDGCKNAITRILTNLPGVSELHADVEKKQLIVRGTAKREEIEEKLKKWATAAGKEVRFVGESEP
jgi:copper chaperone CopZ